MKIKKFKFPSNMVAVDTETTGLNTWTGDRPYIVSWCWFDKKETRGHVRWEVDPFNRIVTHTKKDIKYLKSFLENPTIIKVFHNAKFDKRMLESIEINVKGEVHDTMFMTRCYHNDLPTYGLKPLTKKLLNMNDDELQVLKKACSKSCREGKKKGYKLAISGTGKHIVEADYWMVEDYSLVAKYAVLDAIRAKRLYTYMHELLRMDNQKKIYEKEMRLFPVTYAIETRGAEIDTRILNEEIVYHEKNMIKSYNEVLKISGLKKINLRSPKQVADLFYKKMGIKCTKFTDKGQPSTSIKTLAKIKHPILIPFANYKASAHALSNFFYVYKREAEITSDGRMILHPDFQQMGAKTARFSCKKPNLQNVANDLTSKASTPIRARRPFRPPKGYTWYAFDYSQIEVWLFAILAKESFLLNALIEGRNIHNETGNRTWGKGTDLVAKEIKENGSSDTRKRAKGLLFGKVYGMGIAAAQDSIGCTRSEAKQYMHDFDIAFPRIKQYMQERSAHVERTGFIDSRYGRRYFVESDLSYKVVNHEIQGSCADLMKEKMIELNIYFKKHKIDGGIIMNIHDELMFEINNKFVTKTLLLNIKNIMENHRGIFPEVEKFKVSIDKITSDSSWDKKVKLTL